MTESEDAKLMTESENAKLQGQLAILLGLDLKSVLFKKMVLFDRVEQERDKAKADLEEYKRSCDRALEAKDTELSSDRKAHQEALDRKDREREELKKDYEKRLSEKETEIAGIRVNCDAVVNAKERAIRDLQKDRAGRDETIEHLTKDNGELSAKLQLKRDEFKKEPETKKEIDVEVAKLKKKWEDEDKPKEVDRAASVKLKGIFVELREPSQTTSSVSASELKQLADKMVEDEVKRRIDKKFEERVEAEKNKRVAAIIEGEKQTAMNQWYNNAYIALEGIVRTRVVNLLTEPWPLLCPLCNRPHTHIPTGEDWSYLLSSRSVNVACENPYCVNHFPSGLTGISVSLAWLIDRWIGGTKSTTSQRSNDSPVIF